jgi:hypothetical protein
MRTVMKNPIRACLCILACVFFLVGCALGPGTKAPAAATTEDRIQNEGDFMMLGLLADKDADKEEIKKSLSRLYDRGCTDIDSGEWLKKDGVWTYFIIKSSDQKTFYIDMNDRGMLGTILSQDGMDNANMIAETIGINVNRNILYAAEQMELCGCGHICSIKGSECKKSSYAITIINDRNNEFTITLGDDGELGMIRAQDGSTVYEPIE